MLGGKKMKTKEDVRTVRNNEFYKSNSIMGISLIVLVITIIFSYDEKIKCSNNKGFLLTTIL